MVTKSIQQATKYDRVMIYKFHKDGHGEVVAESLSPGTETYMGMHFPSLDIPDAARAVFVRNIHTHIVDVNAAPVCARRGCVAWTW